MNTIIERLLILNPALERADAEKAIAVLYEPPPAEWMPAARRAPWLQICHQFNVPQIEAQKWYDAVQMGVNVPRLIAHWLDQIGVTEDVLFISS